MNTNVLGIHSNFIPIEHKVYTISHDWYSFTFCNGSQSQKRGHLSSMLYWLSLYSDTSANEWPC